MKKKIIIGALICLTGGLYAQTDAINTQKYWKFRNSFRQDFIKIGANRGEGIPLATRSSVGCVDATGVGIDSTGIVRWADGMIFQGHYIGFLATEYRLLKDRGEDVEATCRLFFQPINL